ncbi:unnamed protein product [Strongylus vulgaris]|uniref:CNH domain-containing protein n=1 Tax=Strongylus vulgaris TaxID=40348 RepID=A0A3P7IPS4_STRVU|nr:unnamed protein product [Strongylus vulgaris]
MAECSGDHAGNDEVEPLQIIQSRFDEIRAYNSSFVVVFPHLDTVITVDVANEITDICATHNYVVVATQEHIYIAHKDDLENPLKCSYELKGQLNLEFEGGSWRSIEEESNKRSTFTHGWSKNNKKQMSDVILTSTLSTIYFVYTVGCVSTVVRLFNEYSYADSKIVRPVVVQIPEDIRIVMAVSGNDHSLFLTEKGAVYALGTGR